MERPRIGQSSYEPTEDNYLLPEYWNKNFVLNFKIYIYGEASSPGIDEIFVVDRSNSVSEWVESGSNSHKLFFFMIYAP